MGCGENETRVRSCIEIKAEIEDRFGFFPPFFEPAMQCPPVLDNLWQQTVLSYISDENPLSVLFKERLNAFLSRYCAEPYCMIVHSAALRPLGMTAGEVLALLDSPLSDSVSEEPILGILPVPPLHEACAPIPDSPLEITLFHCATVLFLDQSESTACQEELLRLLGENAFSHLVMFLAYIKTCHSWITAHPEISYEADQRAIENLGPLLAAEPALAEFFRHYHERVAQFRQTKLTQAAAAEQLQQAHRRIDEVLENISDAFYALDGEMQITYVNRKAEQACGKTRSELIGMHLIDAFPMAAGTYSIDRHVESMSTRQPCKYETLSATMGKWVEVSIYPSGDGLSVFYRDITEQRQMLELQTLLFEREHAIAEQLQNALQLPLPSETPGIVVRKYYEAAFAQEAGVGGDFYDVFSVGAGCTALVVGDISGKGLIAAVQVATVRNMLRAFMYSRGSIAEAVMELNQALAENSLLDGFTTLFVGAYDSDARVLKYVNCGQEPALLKRAATGEIVQLPPTGIILGCIEGESFDEVTVSLDKGDVLAVFSDGLTEAGPTRTNMLGIEGVAMILATDVPAEHTMAADELAESVTLRLIAGVDRAASGDVMRDDVCLLVAVAE